MVRRNASLKFLKTTFRERPIGAGGLMNEKSSRNREILIEVQE